MFSSLSRLLLALLLGALLTIAYLCGPSVQEPVGHTYLLKRVVGNGDTTSKLKVNVPALEASVDRFPYGLVQSKKGDLYFCSALLHVVLKVEFNKPNGPSNVVVLAGTGSPGRGDENKKGTKSALDYPVSISLIEDSRGEVTAIIIVDSGNHRIRQLDMDTQMINTIVGTGTAGSTGDGGLATLAALKSPRHAYIDKLTGDMFIVDSLDNRIRRVFASNKTITTVIGTKKCSDGNKGDGGKATDACLIDPASFVINDIGEWLIAEKSDSVIRKVDTDGNISTLSGSGLINGDGPAKDVKLMGPVSLALTPSGELLVADGRIRKMDHDGFMKILAGGGSSTDDGIPAKTASISPVSVAPAQDGSNDIFFGDSSGYIFKLYFTCFGMDSDHVSACSGHGECIALNNCTCDDGWIGANCSMTPCFGIASSDTSVCSGHGSCVGIDQCQCDDGWMGVDCSITHCFGVTSNLPDVVCSGRGRCVMHNKCGCDGGFRGHKCQRPPGS